MVCQQLSFQIEDLNLLPQYRRKSSRLWGLVLHLPPPTTHKQMDSLNGSYKRSHALSELTFATNHTHGLKCSLCFNLPSIILPLRQLTCRLSKLCTGREPLSPVNFMLEQPDDLPGGMELGESRRVTVWARNWWKARRKLCKFAAQNLKEGACRMKRRYDKGRKPLVANPGDLVLLSVRSLFLLLANARKLHLKYTGPYVVKRRIHPNAYELEGLPPAVPPTQNVSHLRLFFPSPPRV